MKKRILIVDDEEDIVDVVKTRLESVGYEIDCAYDGKEGFDKVKAHKPDLVILDIMMPGLNGSTLCGMLKFDEEYMHIPVIILTARSTMLDKEIGEAVGADAYIVKPFDTAELVATIKSLIKS